MTDAQQNQERDPNKPAPDQHQQGNQNPSDPPQTPDQGQKSGNATGGEGAAGAGTSDGFGRG